MTASENANTYYWSVYDVETGAEVLVGYARYSEARTACVAYRRETGRRGFVVHSSWSVVQVATVQRQHLKSGG